MAFFFFPRGRFINPGPFRRGEAFFFYSSSCILFEHKQIMDSIMTAVFIFSFSAVVGRNRFVFSSFYTTRAECRNRNRKITCSYKNIFEKNNNNIAVDNTNLILMWIYFINIVQLQYVCHARSWKLFPIFLCFPRNYSVLLYMCDAYTSM